MRHPAVRNPVKEKVLGCIRVTMRKIKFVTISIKTLLKKENNPNFSSKIKHKEGVCLNFEHDIL